MQFGLKMSLNFLHISPAGFFSALGPLRQQHHTQLCQQGAQSQHPRVPAHGLTINSMILSIAKFTLVLQARPNQPQRGSISVSALELVGSGLRDL